MFYIKVYFKLCKVTNVLNFVKKTVRTVIFYVFMYFIAQINVRLSLNISFSVVFDSSIVTHDGWLSV